MKIQLIDYGAVALNHLPNRAKPMDAGADVYASISCQIHPGETFKMPLGFGMHLPNGFVGWIQPRGSMCIKGITCMPCPIDASYTGELHSIITNESREIFNVYKGDRIGQLVIVPCIIADFVTESLQERGDNGFGSTGR